MVKRYPHEMHVTSTDDYSCPECDWSGNTPGILAGETAERICPDCGALWDVGDDPTDQSDADA